MGEDLKSLIVMVLIVDSIIFGYYWGLQAGILAACFLAACMVFLALIARTDVDA